MLFCDRCLKSSFVCGHWLGGVNLRRESRCLHIWIRELKAWLLTAAVSRFRNKIQISSNTLPISKEMTSFKLKSQMIRQWSVIRDQIPRCDNATMPDSPDDRSYDATPCSEERETKPQNLSLVGKVWWNPLLGFLVTNIKMPFKRRNDLVVRIQLYFETPRLGPTP